jgi:glutathione peroxidase-family protein
VDPDGDNYPSAPAVLVVNVASQCGYTDTNYKDLQQLHDDYNAHGLEIWAFPCNQFGNQEPDKESQILRFAKYTYHVDFNMFSKVNVNDDEEGRKGHHSVVFKVGDATALHVTFLCLYSLHSAHATFTINTQLYTLQWLKQRSESGPIQWNFSR